MLPEYDLVVIGSGPAGQKGAIAAAKARKNVAVVDRTPMIGGVSVHTGTIPSKTVREAIFQLTSRVVKAQYGNGRVAYGDISVRDVSGKRNHRARNRRRPSSTDAERNQHVSRSGTVSGPAYADGARR